MKKPSTPIPWRYDKDKFGGFIEPDISDRVTAVKEMRKVGGSVDTVQVSGPVEKGLVSMWDYGHQDAEYIIQCCNNFPEVVELLTSAYRVYNDLDKKGALHGIEMIEKEKIKKFLENIYK